MSLSLTASYHFEEFELDLARRTLERNGAIVPLSPKAFDVLSYLVQNPARVITKDELLKAVWPGSFVEEGNLAQHISSLRKAFSDRAGLIVTIPGRGYQFTARVQEPPLADQPPEVPATETNQASGEHDIPGQPAADVLIQRVRERTHLVIEETSAPMPARRYAIPRWAIWSLAAALPVAAAVTYAIHRLTPPPKLQRVMVADFLNTTGDVQFDRSLHSAFSTGLAQSPYIQLMGKGDEHAALAQMEKAPDTPLLNDTALEVCRRGNFEALLRGSIANAAGGYALGLDLVNCSNGTILASFQALAANKDRVLDTLDSLAAKARLKLGESAESLSQYDVPIREATTFSFEALQDFDKGVELGNAGKLEECIPFFQKAVDLDPHFAMAVADLGNAYSALGAVERSTGYYKKAFDLSGGVSEAEKLFIRANYYRVAVRDLDAAAKIYQQETQVYPNESNAWTALAEIEIERSNFPAAVAAGEQALHTSNRKREVDYLNLASAYMRENRFADAKRTIATAQSRGLDALMLHRLLFTMAVIENDPGTLQREIAWSNSQPVRHGSLLMQGIYAADLGQLHRADDLLHAAALAGGKEIDPAFFEGDLLQLAEIELEMGLPEKAKAILKADKADNTGNFAVLSAMAGEPAETQLYLSLPMIYPQETISLYDYRPEMRALIALHRGDPAAAVKELEISRPYELMHPRVIQVRGRAYLALKDGPHAATEFQKLIDHPALDDPPAPRTFLAHVWLARAYTLEGKKPEARAEYEKFFTLWKEADPDVPILQQAHAEYAKL
jgi:DNA-binding winged helix-turn-helix (wHTH) protein/tetratricopeptide (TPR) repeat protein